MGMMNFLSEADRNMIGAYIDAYAAHGRRTAPIEHILRRWSSAKMSLVSIFKDQLILKKEIRFKRSREELYADMNEAMSYGGGEVFYRNFMDLCYEKRLSNDLVVSDMGYTLERLMYNDTLVDNIYSGPTFSIEEPEWDKAIKIQTGARITRILGKLAAAYNLEGFEAFRVAHGQALNQKEMHGTLCLSIHPMDYMTMSDNANGWQSCMNWQNDGCYRQGTVEMMNSDCVIVAYLTSDEGMSVPGGYRWNNKKWRELFIVDENVITNIKGYPYCNSELSMEVMKWLKELVEEAHFGTFDTDIEQYEPWNEINVNGYSFNIDPCTNYMYNDFSDERTQFGIFGAAEIGEMLKNHSYCGYTLNYSGCSECMACGELDIDISEEVSLLGECCDARSRCDACEDLTDVDDLTEVDGEMLCSYCVENTCDTDSIYEELHRCHNLVTLHLADATYISRYQTIRIYADHFDDEQLMGKYFNKICRSYSNFRSGCTLFVRMEDCTKAGLELFNEPCNEDGYIDLDDIGKEAYDFNEAIENGNLFRLRTHYYWYPDTTELPRYVDLVAKN